MTIWQQMHCGTKFVGNSNRPPAADRRETAMLTDRLRLTREIKEN